jgi:tetratricopeptide (TPR) repeat protein
MRFNFISLVAGAILLAGPPKIFGQEGDTVASMNQQVLRLGQQGQYTQARDLAVKALKLSEATVGTEDAQTAECLNNLGGMYENLGDYTNPAAAFQRGLQIREQVLGPEHQYTARNLMNLGGVYLMMGQYARAEPLLLRALAINQKVLGTDSRAAATSMSHLANLYHAMGEYAKAADYAKQVLAISEKLFGPDHTETATAVASLASIYSDFGEYTRAEPLLQRSLTIRENKLGPGHPLTAHSLHALGALYTLMGDYASAEDFYQRALAVQEKNPGPEHPDTAVTLDDLGLLHLRMGDYNQSMALFFRALKIQEKVFGPEHPVVASTLGRLAAIDTKAHDYPNAELMYQRILQIDEKMLGPEHPQTAITLTDLADLHEHMGDLTKAESFVQRALAIQEKTLGPDHPDLSVSLNNLATIYVYAGEFTKAEPLFRRSVAIDQKTLSPDNPNLAIHLSNLATLCYDLQKTNESLALADQAETSRLGLLNNILSFTSEQERLNYEVQNDPYTHFASLGDAPRAALAILRHKGVVLDSLLEDRLVAGAGRNPDVQALIDQVGPAKQKLTQLLLTVPKDTKPETLQSRAETRARLSRQVEQLEGALAQKVGGLGHARRALSVTVQEVQQVIPPHTALVEFIRYQHYLGHEQREMRYGAVVLTNGGAPRWVCLGPAVDIEQNVLLCQRSVRNEQSQEGGLLALALHNLYRQVWSPLAPVIPTDTKTVILSPDAGLNLVSFATLLTLDDQFLAEKYSLRYVASGRDLLHEPVQSTNRDMVIFAAPDYVAGDKTHEPQPGDLLPLPYFAKNADALAAEVRPWDWPVRIYSGAEASETQVRAIHSPRILHFSTHGFYLPETLGGPARFSYLGSMTDTNGRSQPVTLKNPMYRSGIALAGAQITLDAWKRGETPPTDSDGILTAEEVGGLDLSGTWLVVLSACDTGIGELRSGEGVMGLRRGFVQAGAQNLLMTLWPVFDVPSGELLVDFYSALHQDNNPGEALAGVQRDWLVKLRRQYGLLPAVVMAGGFIVNSQGPVQAAHF